MISSDSDNGLLPVINCRWFNSPYLQRILAAGQLVVLYGRVKEAGGRLLMDHPEFEVVDEGEIGDGSLHMGRIVPIYRNGTGLSQRRFREIVWDLFHVPVEPEPSIGVPGRSPIGWDTFLSAHFPSTIEDAELARRKLALFECFTLQLNIAWRRARRKSLPGRVLGKRTGLLGQFYRNLPFDLTGAQKRVIHEIAADMRSREPMFRLLQGDVGAGKTFVAIAAMLLAIESGCQAALMAPTQILAEQHYITFKRWLEPLGVRIAIRTGDRRDSIQESAAQAIIGTHALIHDHALFSDLGLVVIDEQHKFGVAQRTALAKRGVNPDVLVMTATPIPRTMAMTVYGDLDLSMLDEKPSGRGVVVTAVRIKPSQKLINEFVASRLAEGRQVYLVYPVVEESVTGKLASVETEFPKWCRRLPGIEVGMVHGRMRAEEKDSVMEGFRSGRIGALVCTSAIEVGVDVPNATLMIIHDAERFGLSQLHQLRGRVGRGSEKSHCILLSRQESTEVLAKLAVLERTNDGFEIAEEDLRLRGPGDVMGSAQSGLQSFRNAEFANDVELLAEARRAAESVIVEDPRLDGTHARFRALLNASPGEGEDFPHEA